MDLKDTGIGKRDIFDFRKIAHKNTLLLLDDSFTEVVLGKKDMSKVDHVTRLYMDLLKNGVIAVADANHLDSKNLGKRLNKKIGHGTIVVKYNL